MKDILKYLQGKTFSLEEIKQVMNFMVARCDTAISFQINEGDH